MAGPLLQSILYAPIVDLLRTYQSRRATPTADDKWPDLPGVAALLPELDTESHTPGANVGLAAAQEKRRIFQRLVDFLHQQPLPQLLVLEDLHWSDDLSLEWLLYLARSLVHQPILLLITYRSDEVTPPLRHLLAELRRQRATHEVHLSRLIPPQIEAMIRAIFAHAPAVRHEFVTTLHHLTDGNPFFVEEALKALVTVGDIFYVDGLWTRKALSELRIPPTIQDAVQRRTHQLSPAAQHLLTLAAVVGRRCDLPSYSN